MNQKLRILNLEDSETDTELLQARLEEEGIACELVRVETEIEFVSAVERGGYDLLLVDYKLPDFDGMSALVIAKEKCPDIPFVFVSGSIGEDLAIEALKNGATDYVLKDKLSRLAPAVRRALQEAESRSGLKKAAQAVAAAAKEWQKTFDAILSPVFLLDLDGTITRCNKATELLLGKTEDEIVGQHCWELMHGTDRPIPECPIAAMKIDRKRRSAVIPAKDRWLEVTVDPILDEVGELIGVVHTIVDVTERKKLEDQLRHAQKMEAVGTLAGGIAHDFNNILNVIMGYSSMVFDKLEAGSNVKKQMNEVLAAAERAAVLTKRLLVFSRKQVVDVKPVNVNEIIVGIQKMLARMVRENIEITLNLAVSSLTVLADTGQIEQILMNLATNARDAMPEGGRLTISTRLKELDDEYVAAYGYGKPGKYALITVADTGCGIDAETQLKIFEPFFTTKGIGVEVQVYSPVRTRFIPHFFQ